MKQPPTRGSVLWPKHARHRWLLMTLSLSAFVPWSTPGTGLRHAFKSVWKVQTHICSHWARTRASGILPGLSTLVKLGHKASASCWTELGGSSIQQIALFSTYIDIAYIVVISAGKLRKCLLRYLPCTSPALSPLTPACWSHFWGSKPKQQLQNH